MAERSPLTANPQPRRMRSVFASPGKLPERADLHDRGVGRRQQPVGPAHEAGNDRRLDRWTDQVALSAVASQSFQQIPGIRPLYAFGDDVETHAMGELYCR